MCEERKISKNNLEQLHKILPPLAVRLQVNDQNSGNLSFINDHSLILQSEIFNWLFFFFSLYQTFKKTEHSALEIIVVDHSSTEIVYTYTQTLRV